jgi:acyl-CoA synthetase
VVQGFFPPAVSDRAEALGIDIFRSYGSTEHPSITGSWGEAPAAKRKYTDGRPLPAIDIRLVDDDGRDVTAGTPREILSRGPDMFLGYTDSSLTSEAIDAEGWFATGDIGQADEDGYITIVDRKKDIIIRGGENVSALTRPATGWCVTATSRSRSTACRRESAVVGVDHRSRVPGLMAL